MRIEKERIATEILSYKEEIKQLKSQVEILSEEKRQLNDEHLFEV